MTRVLTLEILPGDYAVSQLPPEAALPGWIQGPGLVNIGFGDDELSIVCRADRVPEGVRSDRGWAMIKLAGSFAFDETGVLLAVIRPLSENGIGIFAISTFHRDYLMVKSRDLAAARSLLLACGHVFEGG